MGKSATIITKEVVVMMKRDITTHIPLTMPLFEKLVMEEANPKAEIVIVKVNGNMEYNIAAELLRMDEKYGADPETKIRYVETIFGNRGRDLKSVTKDLEGELELEGADTETKAPTGDLEKLGVAQLRKKLDQVGIDYAPTATKKRLISLLKSVDEEAEETEVATE